MQRVLIVRLGAMGDIIHALPAVAMLRRARPDLMIGWLVERRWAELLSAVKHLPSDIGADRVDAAMQVAAQPIVSLVHIAETKRWRSSLLQAPSEIASLRARLRDARYDVTVDLQGSIKSAALGALAAAPSFVGPARPRERPAKIYYTNMVDPEGAHVIGNAAGTIRSLVELDGRPEDGNIGRDFIAPQRDHPESSIFPIDTAAEAWAEEELARRASPRFVLLNPGAGWGAKQWPPERYGEVARHLAKLGLASLANIAPNETALAQVVELSSEGAAARVECSIGQLIALTRRAALFIGGDTGPMHLANTLGVPVVALFGPTDPERNGPYFRPSVVLRNEKSGTSYSHRKKQDEGLLAIGVEQVVEAARTLLK